MKPVDFKQSTKVLQRSSEITDDGCASGSTQPPVFLSGKNLFKGASAFSRVRSFAVYMSERISGVRRALAYMERHPYDEYRFSGKMVYSMVATIIGCVLGSLAYSLVGKLWHIITQ